MTYLAFDPPTIARGCNTCGVPTQIRTSCGTSDGHVNKEVRDDVIILSKANGVSKLQGKLGFLPLKIIAFGKGMNPHPSAMFYREISKRSKSCRYHALSPRKK